MKPKLSARSIPVDPKLVEQIAGILLKDLKLTSQGLLREATGDPSQIGLLRISLYDMSGKLWQVSIRLEPIWEGESRGQTGSTNKDRVMKNIDLWINDVALARQQGLLKLQKVNGELIPTLGASGTSLDEQERQQMHKARIALVAEILVHELAHTLDPNLDPRSNKPGFLPEQDWGKLSEQDRKKYINQPSEITAYTSQIVYEISKLYKPGLTAQQVLAQSKIWNSHIAPYAEPRKKARIIEAVQRWIEELK